MPGKNEHVRRKEALGGVTPPAPEGHKVLEGELIPATNPVTEWRRRTKARDDVIKVNKGKFGMGRPKGARNVVTREVKEVIAGCFTDIGGRKAFAQWARQNRTEFYKLYAKLLPIQLQATETKQIVIIAKDEEAL